MINKKHVSQNDDTTWKTFREQSKTRHEETPKSSLDGFITLLGTITSTPKTGTTDGHVWCWKHVMYYTHGSIIWAKQTIFEHEKLALDIMYKFPLIQVHLSFSHRICENPPVWHVSMLETLPTTSGSSRRASSVEGAVRGWIFIDFLSIFLRKSREVHNLWVFWQGEFVMNKTNTQK